MEYSSENNEFLVDCLFWHSPYTIRAFYTTCYEIADLFGLQRRDGDPLSRLGGVSRNGAYLEKSPFQFTEVRSILFYVDLV